jgi:predicted nucleic acid-binding protein
VIYLDTNIFIYLFEEHPEYGEPVARIISSLQADHRFACSALTVAECLAKVTDISLETFHALPELHIFPLDETIAVEAGRLQRESSLRIGDAVHLATAIQQRADTFFTNDKRLGKVASGYMNVKGL